MGKPIALQELLIILHQEVNLHVSYDADLIKAIDVEYPSEKLKRREWVTYLEEETGFVFKKLKGRNYIITQVELEEKDDVLTGQVIEIENQKPVPFAAVSIVGRAEGTDTDEAGFFYLSKVGATDSLAIQLLGYETQILAVSDIAADRPIGLVGTNLQLDDVLISQQAIAPIDYQEGQGYYRVRPEQLSLQNGWGEPDLLRSLQSLPGISTFDESAANLSIRGGTPDQNLVLIDGIPVYKLGHFFGMISALNPYIMQDVRVHKGGFGAGYGGRASAVIDVQNKNQPPETLEGEVGLNLLSLHGHLQVPLFKQRASLLLSVRSSINDQLENNVFKNLFRKNFQFGRIAEYRDITEKELLNRNRAKFDYGEVNLKFNYQFKEDDEISISLYNSVDRFLYDFEIDQPFLTQITQDNLDNSNFGVNLSASNRWTPGWQTKLSLVTSDYSSGQVVRYSGDAAADFWVRAVIDNTMHNEHVQFDQIFQIGPEQHLTVGLQLQSFAIGFLTEYEEIWKEDIVKQDLELSNEVATFYFDYTGNLAERLYFSTGLRLNRINEIPMNIWEPRLALQFRPSVESPFLIKFQTGSYKQFVSTLILEEEDTGVGIGNHLWITTTLTDDLPVLLTEDIVLGISYQKNGWLIDLESYLKYTRGLSVLNLQVDRPDDEVFSPGSSDARGLELLVQKKWNAYRSVLAYTLSKVVYQFAELNAGEVFAPPQDQRHRIDWNNFYRWKRFEFILGFHFNSGRPYTRPVGIQTRERQDSEEVYYVLDNQERNRERLRSYHRADLSLQYQIIKPKWQLKTGITIFNLYNQANQIDRRYFVATPDDQDTPEIASVDEISLRRTVNIFVRVGF